MVTIAAIIATKRVYPLSPNFFKNQYLILKGKVNIPLSRNFFSNLYFISQAKNIQEKFKKGSLISKLFFILLIEPLLLHFFQFQKHQD